MRLGLLLTESDVPAKLETARTAEAAGFDSVWLVDFFNSNALVQAAAVAASTSRITVGTGIANAFTRSPLVLGTGILDIDALSGGRFCAGLGTGLARMNEEWFGVPFGKPVTRVRELFALLRALQANAGPGFRWDGESWQLNVPAYQRAQGPRSQVPLLLAGVNRGMIRAAGEFADGLVGHPVHTRRWHQEVTLPLLREGEVAGGREAGACPIYPHLIVSLNDDPTLARQDVRRQIGFSFSVEHYHSILRLHDLEEVGRACRAHLARYDFAAMGDAVPDALVDEIAIACSPDEFHERLRLWAPYTDAPMLFPASIAVPPERRAATVAHLMDVVG